MFTKHWMLRDVAHCKEGCRSESWVRRKLPNRSSFEIKSKEEE